jgi:hypothetical protein
MKNLVVYRFYTPMAHFHWLIFFLFFLQNFINAQTWTAPTMDQFIGINVLIDRADFAKAARFKTVRTYQDWPNDVGKSNTTILKCPLNPYPGFPDVSQKLSWSYSFNKNRAVDYMDVYNRLNAAPVFNRPSPEIFGQIDEAEFNKSADYKPVCDNEKELDPAPYYEQNTPTNNRLLKELPAQYFDKPKDYIQYSKWVSLFAAQFGFYNVTTGHPLFNTFYNFHVQNFKTGTVSSRPRVKYMEIWNEADKFWPDQHILYDPIMDIGFIDPSLTTDIENLLPTYACFRPNEYGAMLSAAYDGHGGALKVIGIEEGKVKYFDLGIKKMDKSMKVVFTGLVDFRHNYVLNTIKAMYNPAGIARPNSLPVPFDVLNFHHYSSSDAPFNELTFKTGYDFAGAGGQTNGVYPEAETEKLKMRVTDLINSLDETSTNTTKSFDLNTKEIWVSEFGYDTYKESNLIDGNTGLEPPLNLNGGDVFYSQGQWLTRSFLELAAGRSDKGRGLDKAFAYKLNDDPNQKDSQFGYCGLLDAQNRPKQSWYFIRTLQNVLKGYTFLGEVNGVFTPDAGQSTLNNLHTYAFKKGGGALAKYILVVWSGTANDIKSTGTLDFNNTIITQNIGNNLSVATKISIQIPDENGRYESIPVNGAKIPSLNVTETPIFIKLGENTPDPKLGPVKLHPINHCFCTGANLSWDIPDGNVYRYYRVYYKQFCGVVGQIPANELNLDINTWTIYAEQLQGSQNQILISGLKGCDDDNTWYAFHVVPVGAGFNGENDEVTPNIVYDATQAMQYHFEDCNATSCLLDKEEFSISEAPSNEWDRIRAIIVPGDYKCDVINLSADAMANPTAFNNANVWQGNTFMLKFNNNQRINSIHIFTSGLGRLKLQYYDVCSDCWRNLPPIEFYQNNNSQWFILTAAQLPQVPITKLRVIRTGLLGTNGVPGDGYGFGVHRFIVCSEDEECTNEGSGISSPEDIKSLRAEQVEYDAATLAWETALINKENPNRGIFDWYEVRYSKQINENGDLINPIGESQGVLTSLNDAEVIYRISDLEPSTTYHVEITAAEQPDSPCPLSGEKTRALLTLRTEQSTEIGERSIENEQIKRSNSIMLTPNPTSDWLMVQGNEFEFSSIEVIDGTGKVHLRKVNSGRNSNMKINVNDLPEGLYYLRLLSEVEVVNKPFVKIKR